MEKTSIHPPEIREISAEATLPVRLPVLRPGRPQQECIFGGDTNPETLHLGTYYEGQLVGVASFMPNSNKNFTHPVQYQLRGMAILPAYQGQGLGKKLLLEGEKRLLQDNSNLLLWFNARETAIEFYRRYGYQTVGAPFMIPDVCVHVVMYRELQ